MVQEAQGNVNYFTELYAVDCSDKTEKKNGLTYLSWSWAWAEIKKRHPDAVYTVYENPEGLFYHTDGKTCWVKTGVTVAGIEHIEYLPVMNHSNKSIPLDAVTSFDVNKAIQRSLTKACARHGLGLYIYAGEDLPEDAAPAGPTVTAKQPVKFLCMECGEVIKPVTFKGEEFPVRRIESASLAKYGRPLCWQCMAKLKAEEAKEKEREDKVNA